VCVCDVKP